MKVCTKSQQKKEFVKGNLYQTKSSSYVFMYTGSNKGVCLNTGYSNVEMADPNYWEDVTDKYCLQEI